jgi:hypothetical protein
MLKTAARPPGEGHAAISVCALRHNRTTAIDALALSARDAGYFSGLRSVALANYLGSASEGVLEENNPTIHQRLAPAR